MAKVLVIPDVHLKTEIFDMADTIMKKFNLDIAVFVGDLVDDWSKENDIKLYKDTITRAIKFKNDYPNSLFCWGNHEIGYLTDYWTCTGNSAIYRNDIRLLLNQYEREVEPKYIQYVDNCLFSHAGVSNDLMLNLEKATDYNVSIEDIAEMFNHSSFAYMGEYNSPLWLRPELSTSYYSKFVQIIGHTPMKEIRNLNNVWFVDTFSTTSNGLAYGNREFMIIGTRSHNVACFTVNKNRVKQTKFIVNNELDKEKLWSNKKDY